MSTYELGPATFAAKYYLYTNSTGYRDLIDTYNLFGDPATRLKMGPTAVNLASFSGNSVYGGIWLNWEMANEQDITGYNLYRADSIFGAQQKLNVRLINADGQTGGSEYQYFDPVEPGRNYSSGWNLFSAAEATRKPPYR